MVNTNCSVPNCWNVRKKFKEFENNISYHRFPKDERTREKWLRFCKISKDYRPGMVICSIHFERECFKRDLKADLMNLPNMRNVLNFGAVPTIYKISKKAPQVSESSISQFDLTDEQMQYINILSESYLTENNDLPTSSSSSVVAVKPKVECTITSDGNNSTDQLLVCNEPVIEELRTYKDALTHLESLEQFALMRENIRAVGLINQLENLFRDEILKSG